MKKITYLLVLAFMVLFSELSAQGEIQRVYLNFQAPEFQREILLGFTPDNAATDGFDYGYDGGSYYNYPNDMGWMIEGERYVIQGVGAFDTTKTYPLGVFLSYESTISIKLQSTENFEEPIDVYIYDSENDNYFLINDTPFELTLGDGEYEDRFYVAFSDPNSLESLSATTFDLENLQIKYSTSTGELILRSHAIHHIENIEVYSILGQKLTSIFSIKDDTANLRIPNQSGNVSLLRITTQNGAFVKKVLLN